LVGRHLKSARSDRTSGMHDDAVIALALAAWKAQPIVGGFSF
jgi:hypothetical protein